MVDKEINRRILIINKEICITINLENLFIKEVDVIEEEMIYVIEVQRNVFAVCVVV